MVDFRSGAIKVQGLPEGIGDPVRVAIVSGGSEGGSTGGLTNVELRAAPVPVDVGTVPVTGEFFPATQPISIAAPVAVTGNFYPATQPVSGSVSVTGSVAVTGTFFQATQPVSIAATVAVSGPLTDVQLRASPVPVSGTVAVTGTFFQATQPVSIAGTVNVAGPLTDTQLRASAIATKDYVQSSRVIRNFILDAFTAAPVAEAMQQVVQYYNGAAVSATAQPAVVPAGKILRLTGGRIETKSLATVGSVVMRVRCNLSGAAVIGSPLVASVACGSRAGATTVAMTGGHDHAEFSFGDEGLEFPAGAGVGFSLAGYGPTGTLTLQGVTRFEVWGYEYTA
jgi:hypothetical protein